MDAIFQLMQDNPLSYMTIKPEFNDMKAALKGQPGYTEQIGWRATWVQVNSDNGTQIAWELFSIGKTPQEAIQRFATDLKQA